MKAYGVPRWRNFEYPDKSDEYLMGKGHRMYNKRATRRIWKKKVRAAENRHGQVVEW